jgi:hypothetical protein
MSNRYPRKSHINAPLTLLRSTVGQRFRKAEADLAVKATLVHTASGWFV